MVTKPLVWQLALVMLLVALVPLAAAGLLTLNLLENSARDQVRTHQQQLGQAAAAMVRNYIHEGQTRLRLIATRLPKGKDPAELGRQLDKQMDPPGILLEIGVVEAKETPEVVVQSQLPGYNKLLNDNAQSNRAFNPRLNQQVTQWSNGMGNIDVPLTGSEFVATALEVVGDVPALPISVPGSDKRVLTANLDFRPVSGMLADMAGSSGEQIQVVDGKNRTVAHGGATVNWDITDFKPLDATVPVGLGSLQVNVLDLESRALAPLRQARKRAYLWFGAAAAMALALATLFARRVVQPIETLSKAAHQIAGGNLAVRSGIQRDDEIGHLARAFDRMAASVQKLDTMKSDFVSHVSHELRTPLTSAKATLANVQEGISGPDALGRVQQDLDRLIRMVNELLDIARIEAGLQLAKQTTDLGGLVRSTVETMRPLAMVALNVSGNGDTFDLDAARVQQILLNLVDNALKYAKSRVDVDIRGREVRVTDDGPGVPAGHRERIFEKFSKVETGPKPPGAGLGLSIARKLAQLHGGSLVCEGNTFVLRF